MKYLIFLIKYLTIILFFIILIILTKYYGNYCSDIPTKLFFLPIIFVLIIINITILYLLDSKHKNFKTTNKVLIFLLCIFVINLLIGFIPNFKTVKYKIKIKSDFQTPELTLFTNNTYRLKTGYPHGQCFSLGKYLVKDDTLILNDQIIQQSQNLISIKYLLNYKTKSIKSLKKGIDDLEIIE